MNNIHYLYKKIMTENYTIEQFELDFDDAPNLELKREVLIKALDIFDGSDSIIKESLLKHKEELMDLKSEMEKGEDVKCNSDIDNELVELYTCIKEINDDSFKGSVKVGSRYYIKVDDIVASLDEKWSEVATDEMKEFISKMKPTIWIYMDSGIGSLKYREILKGDVLEYFEL